MMRAFTEHVLCSRYHPKYVQGLTSTQMHKTSERTVK